MNLNEWAAVESGQVYITTSLQRTGPRDAYITEHLFMFCAYIFTAPQLILLIFEGENCIGMNYLLAKVHQDRINRAPVTD